MSWRDRITTHVLEEKGCIIVTSHKPDNQGYIRIKINCQNIAVHKLAFEEVHGTVPYKKEIHHKCKNKTCINVEHLELLSKSAHSRLTRIENTSPNCPKGHLMEGDNLGIDKRGKRFCRICSRAAINAWYDKNKVNIRIQKALKNGF